MPLGLLTLREKERVKELYILILKSPIRRHGRGRKQFEVFGRIQRILCNLFSARQTDRRTDRGDRERFPFYSLIFHVHIHSQTKVLDPGNLSSLFSLLPFHLLFSHVSIERIVFLPVAESQRSINAA